MNEQIISLLDELETLENAVDRQISDKKVLSMELDARDKHINDLSEIVKSSGDDLGKIKERIAKLLLEKQ